MAVVPLPRPSWRVRAYLGIRACMYLWFAFTYVVSSERLDANPTFNVVEQLMPVEWFGLVFVALGVACIGGIIFPADRPTRVVLGISAVTGSLFGAGILFAGTDSPAAGTFLGLAAIDLLLTSTDYRPRP